MSEEKKKITHKSGVN